MPSELPIACTLSATDYPARLAQMRAGAESDCCSFLDMTVTDEPDAVVLTIDAPDDAEPVLGELVSAFRGDSQVAA